jgi:hypothetical protein
MMAAVAPDRESASESCYFALLANFDAAYKHMQDSSREFSAVLMNVPAGLSPEERRERNDRARMAYDDARDRCMAAVAKLNEFVIGIAISSRATIRPLVARM